MRRARAIRRPSTPRLARAVRPPNPITQTATSRTLSRKRRFDMARNQPNDYAIVPSVVHSHRSLVTLNRGLEIEQAIGEVGQGTLDVLGNITRAAASHVRAGGAVRDMLKKGAEATREIPQEEAEAELEIHKTFL